MKKGTIRNIGIILIITVILAYPIEKGVAASKDQPITLNVALFHGPAAECSIVWKSYEKVFEQATSGRVLIKVFPTGTLVKGTAHLDGVQRGICDLAFSWPPYLGQTYPMADMCLTPGVFRDIKGAREAYENGIKDILQEEYEASGLNNVQIIEMLQFGERYLASKKKVRSPKDVVGMKMRSTGAAEVELLKLCGAGTVGMNLPEAYEALQRGVIEGGAATLGNMYNERWGEVVKYMLDIPIFGQSAMALIASKNSLAKIPGDLKGTVIELLKSCLYRIELVRLEDSNYVRHSWLPARGVEFYRPTKDELTEWDAKSEKVLQKWLERSGERGQRALAIAKKFNAEH